MRRPRQTADAINGNTMLQRLPKGIKTRLRNMWAPDEANLVYRALRHRPASKVMLDVGACFGSAFDRFARDGWTIYAFEPDPVNREKLAARWSDFDNVFVDPRAVSDQAESDVALFRSEISAGISGLTSFHPTHEACCTVDTVTLDAFCRAKGITQIDFLKVDTEGYDLFVLRRVPWSEIRPRIVLCEFEDRKTVPLGYRFHDLADYLLQRDYEVLISEWYPIATYGETHRWRRFESYPCSLMDEAAWGNLIAVRDPSDLKRITSLSNRLDPAWRMGTRIRRLFKSLH